MHTQTKNNMVEIHLGDDQGTTEILRLKPEVAAILCNLLKKEVEQCKKN